MSFYFCIRLLYLVYFKGTGFILGTGIESKKIGSVTQKLLIYKKPELTGFSFLYFKVTGTETKTFK